MSAFFEETIPVTGKPSPVTLDASMAGASVVLEVTASNAYGSTTARSPVLPIAGGGDLDVHIMAQTQTTVTLAWTPVPDAIGYMYLLDGSDKLADNKRHFTFDGSVASVKIGRPADGKQHRYGVRALLAGPSGEVSL